jgi:hypothetical protein
MHGATYERIFGGISHKAAGAAFAEGVFVHHATRGIPAHLRG